MHAYQVARELYMRSVELQVIYRGDICKGDLSQQSFIYYEIDLSQVI